MHHYLKTDTTKNNDIQLVPRHWRGLHNRQFLIFFQKFGKKIKLSKPAELRCLASYSKNTDRYNENPTEELRTILLG